MIDIEHMKEQAQQLKQLLEARYGTRAKLGGLNPVSGKFYFGFPHTDTNPVAVNDGLVTDVAVRAATEPDFNVLVLPTRRGVAARYLEPEEAS